MSVTTCGKASSGVTGLDNVLGGGFTRQSLFLLEGSPGTGKTTMALPFLLEGAKAGEQGLYITLSETKPELIAGATSHGWTIPANVEVFELQPPDTVLNPDYQQSLLYASDLELGETIKLVFDAVDRLQPSRIVIDSLSEIRLLAQSSLRYRRQLLALKHYFAKIGACVLALDDLTSEAMDMTAHSIAHGVLRLEQLTPDYGAERRRMRVVKYRGQSYRAGYHDFIIATGGVQIFPRLVSSEHRDGFVPSTVSTGNAEFDQLLGGGMEGGSSTLLLGPAGSGKSLLTLQFAVTALQRGDAAALFVFDEELGLLFRRAKQIGFDLEGFQRSGKLIVRQIDAAELSPGQFAHEVRQLVVENSVRMIVIDSLNGYQASMPEERSLILHMHELLQYLNRGGVTTFLTIAQHGMVGTMQTPVDVTYLADTVLLLRYFEAQGHIRRALSVIKKRTGAHEYTIREFKVGSRGIELGSPLTEFQGVLTGVPTYTGVAKPLLKT